MVYITEINGNIKMHGRTVKYLKQIMVSMHTQRVSTRKEKAQHPHKGSDIQGRIEPSARLPPPQAQRSISKDRPTLPRTM
ncbi:hypothetical protein JB92DRAFT_2844002, partial [Gautieria morchelliformis]